MFNTPPSGHRPPPTDNLNINELLNFANRLDPNYLQQPTDTVSNEGNNDIQSTVTDYDNDTQDDSSENPEDNHTSDIDDDSNHTPSPRLHRNIKVLTADEANEEHGSSKFEVATFNRIIPEYNGDTEKLKVFLSRCDKYNKTLTIKGQNLFLHHLIFKLTDRAFIIYESKPLTNWLTLKRDLLTAIADKKSIATIQNELLALKQKSGQSVTDFSEQIRVKLKNLSDKISELYQDPLIHDSFSIEHEKMAIRAFKEGLLPPLKYRAVAFNDNNFEKLRQFVLEEEPFTNSSNIVNTNTHFQPRPNRQYQFQQRWNNNNYSKNGNFDYNSSNGYNPNHNRNTQSYNASNNTNRNSFQNTTNNGWRYNQQNNGWRSNSQNNDWRSNQPTQNFSGRQNQIVCHRCGKPGHLRSSCFVKLPNEQSPMVANTTTPNNATPATIQTLSHRSSAKNYPSDGVYNKPVQTGQLKFK